MTSRTIDKHCRQCNKYLYSVQPTDYDGISKDVFCCEAHKVEYQNTLKTESEQKPKHKEESTEARIYRLWLSASDCY